MQKMTIVKNKLGAILGIKLNGEAIPDISDVSYVPHTSNRPAKIRATFEKLPGLVTFEEVNTLASRLDQVPQPKSDGVATEELIRQLTEKNALIEALRAGIDDLKVQLKAATEAPAKKPGRPKKTETQGAN